MTWPAPLAGLCVRRRVPAALPKRGVRPAPLPAIVVPAQRRYSSKLWATPAAYSSRAPARPERASPMARAAAMPDRKALLTPCDESGSQAIAASPTASHFSPAAQPKQRLSAGVARRPLRSPAGHPAARPHGFLQSRRPETVEGARRRRQEIEVGHVGDDQPVARQDGRIPPAPFGRLQQEPRVVPAPPASNVPATPISRSKTNGRAPSRRASQAVRPVASIRNSAARQADRPSDRAATHQPPAESREQLRTSVLRRRTAPRCSAAAARVASNRPRSRCQPTR